MGRRNKLFCGISNLRDEFVAKDGYNFTGHFGLPGKE
jgi:hypothetical protein